MSMRATFTTSFIYDGREGYQERRDSIVKILGDEFGNTVIQDGKKKNMIGQIAGVTKGLDLGEEDIRQEIQEICCKLWKIKTVPFYIVWILEGDEVVVRRIESD